MEEKSRKVEEEEVVRDISDSSIIQSKGSDRHHLGLSELYQGRI